MKTIKTRLISTLLVVMTLLSLLPTTAFAATGTGKGITITTNQVYWSTRIPKFKTSCGNAAAGGHNRLLPQLS